MSKLAWCLMLLSKATCSYLLLFKVQTPIPRRHSQKNQCLLNIMETKTSVLDIKYAVCHQSCVLQQLILTLSFIISKADSKGCLISNDSHIWILEQSMDMLPIISLSFQNQTFYLEPRNLEIIQTCVIVDCPSLLLQHYNIFYHEAGN